MKPNVLLLILDSVRARNTSLYGHVNQTTPFLERFAKTATTFTQARAPSTWSLPSHVSMFTGLHPEEHTLKSRSQRLSPGHTFWEELSNEYGYATGVFSSNPFLTAAPVGLMSTFDTAIGLADLPFEDAIDPREFVREHGHGKYLTFLREAIHSDRPVASVLNGCYEKLIRTAPVLIPNVIRNETSGEQYAEQFLQWQAEQHGPWAACVNLMDAHQPYQPASEYDHWGGGYLRGLQRQIESNWEFNGGQRPWWQRGAIEALYDGAIRQLDGILEALITELQQQNVLDNTLVIITGDHGEGFGEPSEIRPGARAVGHGNGGSHEVLLHVPLVIKHPDQQDKAVVHKVCSLTTLPNLIKNVVVEDHQSAFPPDEPVIASGYGLNERMRRNARKYCDDLTLFEDDTLIYYEDTENGATLYKMIIWQDKEATVEIRDAQTSYNVKESVDERIHTIHKGIKAKAVTGEAPGVDREIHRRLEDLGYA